MILKHLSLRGAIGIQDGLGKDQVDVNFADFAPGLIALIGPNGAGKSTFVGNLVPYRGGLHSRPGSLGRQFYLKDSHRDLLVEIGGDEYRFLLNINGERGTIAESVAIKNGITLNPDGKEETYNAIVEQLFGPSDLFFRSLFMPQKRESFASIRPADRKDILLRLMGADKIQPKCEYASKRAATIAVEIEKAEAELRRIDLQIADLGLIEETLASLETQLSACVEGTQEAEQRIALIEAEIADLQQREQDQAVLAEQVRQADVRLAELAKTKGSLTLDYAKRIESVDAERRKASADRDRLSLGRSDDARKRLVMAVEGVEKITANYLASVEIGNKHADLSRRLAEARTEYADAKARYQAECNAAVARRDKADGELKTATQKHDAERRRLADDLSRKQYAAKVLGTVPCQQTDSAEECRACTFLKDAVKAKDELDAVASALAVLDENWENVRSSLKSAFDTADAGCVSPEFECSRMVLNETGENIIEKGKALSGEIAVLGYDASRAAELKRQYEENQRTNPAERLRQYDADGEKIEQLGLVIDGATEQMHALEVERDEKIEGVDNESHYCQAEKADLGKKIDIVLPLRLRDKRDELKGVRTRSEALASTKQDILTKQGMLQEDAASAEQLRAEADAITGRISGLRSDSADWQHLNLALSRNGGYQSMLVESFGQEISAFVNERLPAYRLPWSIEIATSKPTVDGKGLTEGFWVMINTDPFPRELGLISGGQEVWVEALIYDAIAHLMRKRSGKDIRTVIRDEADGALSSAMAIVYADVIAASHQASGMHHTLLITHRPEIQDRIGQRLLFVKGEGIRTEIE